MAEAQTHGRRSRDHVASIGPACYDPFITSWIAALVCPSCGSAVALCAGTHAVCAHCLERVEIPAEHRELRALTSPVASTA
jgi:hypothetical protein